MAGLVRVTCAETVADHILAQGLATLYLRHPEIMVELIPDPRELSLSMREADISVRLKQTDDTISSCAASGPLHSDFMPAPSIWSVTEDRISKLAAPVITSSRSLKIFRTRRRRAG